MLVALEWRISLPTANPFLHRFLSITGACKVTRHCSQYYLERSLLEHDMLVYRPSVVAASSVVLAINNTSLFEGDMEGRRNRKKSTRRKGFVRGIIMRLLKQVSSPSPPTASDTHGIYEVRALLALVYGELFQNTISRA